MKKANESFPNKFLWKIGGEAGFGIMTTGLTFSKIASRSGHYVFDYVEYPSLIRGGHNAYAVHVGKDEVHSLKRTIDVLICLNKQTYEINKYNLDSDAVVIYDADEFEITENIQKASVPFRRILKENQGSSIMKNTVALGASLAVVKGNIEWLYEIIEKQFAKKGEKVVEFNKLFARLGYEYIVKESPQVRRDVFNASEFTKNKLVMTGNDAFALASIIANCKLYCAYPMTPSSSILSTMASWQQSAGIVARHAEDEISVINTALGASFAGVRAAVGTSGGGFALMVESVSLAGVTETPIVIFLSQRPGPATGMPTWTEQGDLLFAVHAGHGEFPKIVLAPGDVQEMIELTSKAFNLADIYQTPVIVMSDMLLSESHKSLSKEWLDSFIKRYQIDRGKTVSIPTKRPYLRYEVTDDGISERLIPGQKGFYYQANSYSHDENSHTTEDANARKKQVDKRNRKTYTYLKDHFFPPAVYGELTDAELVFVSWGSSKGSILEAMKQLDKKTAYIHFTHLYPLDHGKIANLFDSKKQFILIENNSQAQFGKLLRQETGIEIRTRLLKYDGRPILPEDIIEFVQTVT